MSCFYLPDGALFVGDAFPISAPLAAIWFTTSGLDVYYRAGLDLSMHPSTTAQPLHGMTT